MCNLDKMSWMDLQAMRMRIDEEVEKWRAVRIKVRWKRCGKKQCFCMSGPSDGSWDNLHGPYVFAQYVDRDTRKTKVVSLGPHYDEIDRQEITDLRIDLKKYFNVDSTKLQSMTQEKQDQNMWFVNLTEQQFEEMYGIPSSEDVFDRPKKLYGTKANYDAYTSRKREIEECKAAALSHWSIVYGIGSPRGQQVLKDLLRDKYFLAD